MNVLGKHIVGEGDFMIAKWLPSSKCICRHGMLQMMSVHANNLLPYIAGLALS